MDRDRLVNVSLGQLNRGLLIFRLGLYGAVVLGLLERDAQLAVVAVAALAFVPAIPALPYRIEIGVASTLLLEMILTFLYGAYPALQIMAMFSVAVAGLFLTRRVATFALYGAVAFQLATMAAEALNVLPTGADLTDLVAETVLLLAAGVGFIEIGGILRTYQAKLIDQAREELRLTEMIESKDRLIDSVAHEIRTPVTAVLGLSSELSAGRFLDPDEVAEIAELVAVESRRLAHLVDNLVLRSRSEIDKLTFNSEDLNLPEVMRSSWGVLGLDPDSLTIVGDGWTRGDRERLQHIFVNVFDNSIRHGSIPVAAEIVEDSGSVSVRVTDAGPGFDIEVLERALLKYEGGGDTHRPDHVGLGLPVSRMLAEHMEGAVTVTGEGVVVTFPATRVPVDA
jgi:signal transduction histidine kinase